MASRNTWENLEVLENASPVGWDGSAHSVSNFPVMNADKTPVSDGSGSQIGGERVKGEGVARINVHKTIRGRVWRVGEQRG